MFQFVLSVSPSGFVLMFVNGGRQGAAMLDLVCSLALARLTQPI